MCFPKILPETIITFSAQFPDINVLFIISQKGHIEASCITKQRSSKATSTQRLPSTI